MSAVLYMFLGGALVLAGQLFERWTRPMDDMDDE